MNKRFVFVVVTLLAALLAGCATDQGTPNATTPAETEPAATAAPTEAMEVTPTPFSDGDGGALPSEANDLAEAARTDLAARLEIDRQSIEVVHIEAMNWPDAGLGCPALDIDYATVVTPGYQIELRVDGELYEYHTDATSQLVLCQDGEPRLPVVPMEAEGTAEN